MTTKIQQAADTLAAAFETAERPDGAAFIRCTDDAPPWINDAIREAHDGELPNDWRYAACSGLADSLAEFIRYNDGEINDDWHHEACDGAVDVYTSDLCDWMSHGRTHYVDEAKAEFGDAADVEKAMQQGQYYCLSQMASILQSAVEAAAEDTDDEQDDDQ